MRLNMCETVRDKHPSGYFGVRDFDCLGRASNDGKSGKRAHKLPVCEIILAFDFRQAQNKENEF